MMRWLVGFDITEPAGKQEHVDCGTGLADGKKEHERSLHVF
jgi:hypothetical protein